MALYHKVNGRLVKVNDAAQEWDRLPTSKKKEIVKRAFPKIERDSGGDIPVYSWADYSSAERFEIIAKW